MPGGIASLLEASGCKQTNDRVGVALISYAADGRPKRIVFGKEGLSPACQVALTTLARLTLEESNHAATEGEQIFVMPFNKDVVACADAGSRAQAEQRPPARVGQEMRTIKPPHKTRDVKPQYPVEAQRQGIQGVVVLEAVISARGCVERAQVIRGVYPSLDVAALRAVMGWLFTPTTLDGTALQ